MARQKLLAIRSAFVLYCLFTGGIANATTFLVDTTSGSINAQFTLLGNLISVPLTDVNGTPFTTSISQGITTFSFAGDLNLGSTDVVTGRGARMARFVVGNNVNIAPGASVDFSAFTANGPGGGVGGTGGNGGTFGFATPPIGGQFRALGGDGGNGGDGTFSASSNDNEDLGTSGSAGQGGINFVTKGFPGASGGNGASGGAGANSPGSAGLGGAGAAGGPFDPIATVTQGAGGAAGRSARFTGV